MSVSQFSEPAACVSNVHFIRAEDVFLHSERAEMLAISPNLHIQLTQQHPIGDVLFPPDGI